MPEPISSIASGKILEHYRRILSWGTRDHTEADDLKQRRPVTDTVEISQEARERLRQVELAEAKEQVRKEALRKAQDAALEQSYRTLELGAYAPQEAVRSAYRHLLQHYHPDKYSHLPPEFRKLAEDKVQQIIEAYKKLTE